MKIEQEIQQSQFTHPKQKAMLNIIYTGHWLVSEVEGLLKEFDITSQQYNVLRILRGQKGKSINLYEIQQRMLSPMSNATRLVEKLRKKSLLSRTVCKSNRRKVDIKITGKGLILLERIDPLMDAHMKQFAREVADEQLEQLSDWLDKIRS